MLLFTPALTIAETLVAMRYFLTISLILYFQFTYSQSGNVHEFNLSYTIDGVRSSIDSTTLLLRITNTSIESYVTCVYPENEISSKEDTLNTHYYSFRDSIYIKMELPNFSVDLIKLHHKNNLFLLKTQIA